MHRPMSSPLWGVSHSTTYQTRGPDRVAWIVVLLIQSVPYVSSLLVSLASAYPLPAKLLGRAIGSTSSIRRNGLSPTLWSEANKDGPPEAGRSLKAIGLMLTAVAAFSGMDTLLKLLSQHYPPLQVVALRGAGRLPFMLVPLIADGSRECAEACPHRHAFPFAACCSCLSSLPSCTPCVRCLWQMPMQFFSAPLS